MMVALMLPDRVRGLEPPVRGVAVRAADALTLYIYNMCMYVYIYIYIYICIHI